MPVGSQTGHGEYRNSLNLHRFRRDSPRKDTVNPISMGTLKKSQGPPTAAFQKQDKDFLLPRCHIREEEEEEHNLKVLRKAFI